MRPKCLVLLATHNAGQHLIALVDSVLAQTGVQIDILISDDKSTDDTVSICRKYEQDYANINLLNNDKAFKSASKNFFNLILNVEFDTQDYDYVAFCDQDDIWKDNKLAAASDALASGAYDGYSCSTATFSEHDIKSSVLTQSSSITELDYLFEGAGQGCTFVVTRKLMQSFKEFLSRNFPELSTLHYHDWTIYAYSRATNSRWHFDNNVYLNYRQHDENDTGAKQGLKAYTARISLVKSGWYINQIRILAHCLKSEFPDNPATSYVCRNPYLNGKESTPFSLKIWLNTMIKLLKEGRRKKTDRFALGVFFLMGWLSLGYEQ